jgi:putative FmdB family regulatory protein
MRTPCESVRFGASESVLIRWARARLEDLIAAAPVVRVARQMNLRHHSAAVPTYDYQCRSCASVTEVIHSMTESGPTVCERCGGELRRVLFPTGIIFKGSGFYRTDSRAGTPASEGTDAGGSGAKPAASDSASGSTPAPNAPKADAPST